MTNETTPKKKRTNEDPEFEAMRKVGKALEGLSPDAQRRVINYVKAKLDEPLMVARQAAVQLRSPGPYSDAGAADAK